MAMNSEEIMKKAKQFSNKKVLLSLASFLIVLAVCVLSAIPEFMINPAQIATHRFATKLLTSIMIGLTSLVCFLFIAQSVNGLNEASKIYKARLAFRTSAEDIVKNKYKRFRQWVIRVRRPQQQEKVNKRVLASVGITDMRLLDMSEEELRALMEHSEQTKKFKKITQEQFDVIRSIQTGKTHLQFLDVNDYLIENTMGVDQTDEELLIAQFQKRRKKFAGILSTKILIMVAMSVLLGSIGWQTLENLEEEMTEVQRTFSIIWDILSKLGTAAMSALMGFFEGVSFNDIDAGYLDIKRMVHITFNEDKNFKELTDEEEAHEEWLKEEIEINKKANEEYANKLGLRDEDKEVKNEIITL